jgi:aldehyde:ferredoxin oxidoreductase
VVHGFYKRIIKVNLSDKTFEFERIGEEVYARYLGGKGFGSYLLQRDNPPGIDPLAPENHLIFATGPLTGNPVWGGCRYGVFTKSPQTGIYSESYSGGKVPEAIDAAGFDAIVIHGSCALPTVLSVTPEGVGFHDAADLWGMDTYQAEDAVKERFGKEGDRYPRTGAVVIGPAGENLVRFAVIENDHWRSAGRTGAGTVMGSKRLKAILFQGDRRRTFYDEKGMRALSKELGEMSRGHAGVKAYKTMGTPMMVKIVNQAGAFPTRYWSQGVFDRWKMIDADALHARCKVVPNACPKCFMSCGRLTTILEGRHRGLTLEGPEYETIYAFGGLCLIDSIEEIAYLNDICDRLGMDTITAGNLCAFAIEAVRRGRLLYPIEYGDVDAIAALLRQIAAKEGIGAILAEGIRPAAKAWGLEEIAVHVKGLEPAGYDPRVLKGMGLGYAISDRGACHLRATFYKPELAGLIKPEQIEGKAELFVDYEHRLVLFDSLILCRFFRDIYGWEPLARIIRAATGLSTSRELLEEMAKGIADLIRRFNMREGLRPEDDRLPKNLHSMPLDSGHAIEEAEMSFMVKAYYRLHGWNEEGIPQGRLPDVSEGEEVFGSPGK